MVRDMRQHVADVQGQADSAREERANPEEKWAVGAIRELIRIGQLPEVEGVEKPLTGASDAEIEVWATAFVSAMAERELTVRGETGNLSYQVLDVGKARKLLQGRLNMRPEQENADFGDIKLGDRLDVVFNQSAEVYVDHPPSPSPLPHLQSEAPSPPPNAAGEVHHASTSSSAPLGRSAAAQEVGPSTSVSFILKRTEKGKRANVMAPSEGFSLPTWNDLRQSQVFNEAFSLKDDIQCVVCKTSLQEDAAAIANGTKSPYFCLCGFLPECGRTETTRRHETSFVHAKCLRDSLSATSKCPVCYRQCSGTASMMTDYSPGFVMVDEACSAEDASFPGDATRDEPHQRLLGVPFLFSTMSPGGLLLLRRAWLARSSPLSQPLLDRGDDETV